MQQTNTISHLISLSLFSVRIPVPLASFRKKRECLMFETHVSENVFYVVW